LLVISQKETALRDEYDGPAQSKWPKTEVWFSLEQSLSFVIILPDRVNLGHYVLGRTSITIPIVRPVWPLLEPVIVAVLQN